MFLLSYLQPIQLQQNIYQNCIVINSNPVQYQQVIQVPTGYPLVVNHSPSKTCTTSGSVDFFQSNTNVLPSTKTCTTSGPSRYANVLPSTNTIQQLPPELKIPSLPLDLLKINSNNINPVQTNCIATTEPPPPIANNSFKCNVCNKRFKHQTNLKIHQKIHTESALSCSFCNKRFARSSNLEQHIRVHTGERPFKCLYCPKAFKQRHSLMDHHRVHTKSKPFRCKYCEKGFAAKCNLIVHTRVHTGEKPYKCAYCSKRYCSKSGYNSHQKKYHQK